MDDRGTDRPALVGAALIGAGLQLGMVIGGHFSAPVANLFAVGGTGVAAATGLLYGFRAGGASRRSAALGGAVVGSSAALLAFVVAYLLGDVPAAVLGPAVLGSALAGLLGGLLGCSLKWREGS